jgi:redox-sensing transcriptional repressor
MMTNTPQPVSRATLLRLPSYHRVLKAYAAAGREQVSCTRIAEQLHLDATQVRKDIASTGIVGRPKVGYRVVDLLDAIERFLGWNNVTDAFLVGAGHLGSALLGYQGFGEYGMNIVAAFDASPAKVGRTIGGKEVLPIEKLPDLAGRMGVLIGIITVGAESAQEVANLMVISGIKAIWNFTPVGLELPESIVVENVQLSASLSVLSHKLAEKIANEVQSAAE